MATVNGTSFADNLIGTSGNDTINGRAGDDVIRGGGGRDTITLGSGHDTVVYAAVTDSPFTSNWDLITDFARGDDRIDLSAFLGAADLSWGGLTATANGVWYSRSGTTVSIFIDTDNALATPEMRIDLQNMSTTTVLDASDFIGVVARTNGAPVFASQANWSVPENSTAIGTVVATDADSPTVTYSLVVGVDSGRFFIDPRTGVLSFVMAPNFEAPVDTGADDVYNFTVRASDGSLNTTQAVTVTVTNVNEAAPVITSPASFTLPENGLAVTTVLATDADNQAVTYSVTGTDAARFTIDPATGVLAFTTAPDFEAPTDANADNVYNFSVQASDGTLNTTQALTVTVTNVVNETLTGDAAANTLVGAAGNDIITGNAGADTLTGNGGNDTFIYASAQDSLANANWQTPPDATVPRLWDTITDFTQGADKIDLSALLGATDLGWGGTAPTGNSVWYVNSGTQTFIYVDIDNNPPPDLMIALQNRGSMTLTPNDFIGVLGGFTNAVNETLTGDAAANTLVGAAGNDIITGNAGADALTGNGGNDTFVYASAQDSLANTNWQTPPDATVPRLWDTITDFTQGADKIDLSALLGATDLGWGGTAPTGNSVWYVNSGTQTFIYVDIDNNPPPDLMIALQNRGSMTLAANDFIGVLGAFTGNGGTGAAPGFTSSATFAMPENGTAVGTVTATDADSPTVTYSIVAGGDSASFAIDPTTGALAFRTAPDFEAPTDVGVDNVYNFTVRASDGTLDTTQAVAVIVSDVVVEPIAGSAGNDILTGTAGDDLIDISAGGNDTVSAGSGTDIILAGAAFNAADRIDGGTEIADTIETDTLILDGNYAAGVVFEATTLVNVEEIRLADGNSYRFTTSDATVVTASLSIDGSALLAANTLTVNASAETEAGASYTLTGGAGNDVLVGGAGADYVDISFDGNDIVNGGAGRDTIYAGSALSAADQINGGAGTDVIYLNGNYSAGLTLGASTLTAIEAIVVQAGNNYSLTMNNAMLVGAQTATVDGFALGSGNTLTVNASPEADSGTIYTLSGGAGNDNLTGGAGNDLLNGNGGNDILVGGAGNDILTGGAGNDAMTGGAGNDVFDYSVIADRGTSGDIITDFSRSGADGVDVLDLHDLLQSFAGYNGSNAYTGGYLQFDTSSGTSTVVRVDATGGGDSYVTLVTLTGTLLQTDTTNYVL